MTERLSLSHVISNVKNLKRGSRINCLYMEFYMMVNINTNNIVCLNFNQSPTVLF